LFSAGCSLFPFALRSCSGACITQQHDRNGGADPTIGGDAEHKWKQGRPKVRIAEDRVFILFNWDHGKRKGLIDARRDGASRLIGKYINLTDPKIIRPWVSLVVSSQRIDGQWSGGPLDFAAKRQSKRVPAAAA
jgi:hypothetical protein